ncbi:MAG TPA: fused MFS/spermidine synthase [Mycobacteriales bacterium]|nr:fused MFS/spermidine synthase [Mycobacteriales bacterium]
MKVELIRDATRDSGWWLLVDRSEQSFVDTEDPLHLEFEYVQMIGHLLEVALPGSAPIVALHLGGGLCTVPRWLVVRHPGSRQRVIEHSAEIARLAASLGRIAGTTVKLDDAAVALSRTRPSRFDLVVSDVYEGPETVTGMFTGEALRSAHRALRPGGLYVCNLSDAVPFALAKVVAATMREIFSDVVMLAEPGVLRGRRSGNIVLAGADRALPSAELRRRGAANSVRFRVLADTDLTEFIGTTRSVRDGQQLPRSGESTGRRLG